LIRFFYDGEAVNEHVLIARSMQVTKKESGHESA